MNVSTRVDDFGDSIKGNVLLTFFLTNRGIREVSHNSESTDGEGSYGERGPQGNSPRVGFRTYTSVFRPSSNRGDFRPKGPV